MSFEAHAIVARNYTELMRDISEVPAREKRELRAAFYDVGEIVRLSANELFDKYSPLTAAGFRVRVRQRGVVVEQSLRKTTGLRPDYGALQMRQALLPARTKTYEETYVRFEQAADNAVEKLSHGG